MMTKIEAEYVAKLEAKLEPEMSSTPRTDAMEASLETGNFVKRVAKAMLFARTLERELNEAKRQAVLYNADTMKVMEQRDELKAMVQKLTKEGTALLDLLNKTKA